MSLINDIKRTQISAAEDAVCQRLEDLGLIGKPVATETQLEADARRYRFLRDKTDMAYAIFMHSGNIDVAIDAAMSDGNNLTDGSI